MIWVFSTRNQFVFIDINECIEPSVDGTYNTPCTAAQLCTNTIGSYTCACDPIFNINGTCICMCKVLPKRKFYKNFFNLLDNASLCTFPNNDTCVVSNTTVCLHGTINQNNTCIRM